MHDKILILDFGSQCTQLIARRVREAHVYAEVYPYDVDDKFVRDFKANGVILSGGPSSVTNVDMPLVPQAVFHLGVPVLGICYGMQAMAMQLGGKVERCHVREFGYAEAYVCDHTKLLEGLEDFRTPQGRSIQKVWMSHGDKVVVIPPGFKLIASSESCLIAAIADEDRQFYGLQWHPEVTHTTKGRDILNRFVLELCGAKPDWEMGQHYIAKAVEQIRAQVGNEQVILGLSGGVDSSVAAVLLHRAIGDQLTCVFVDHGLLRLNETDQVIKTFSEHLGLNVIHVDASDLFIRKLTGITDPEHKRKIIGSEFINVFQREALKLRNTQWFAQGTIYPDVIESAGKDNKGAHTIKSHHNVGGLPDTLNLKLLEPLRKLFKDEVRALGIRLNLPPSIVYRHPFPGPGLGVRIIGEVKREFIDLLRKADAIFTETLRTTIDLDSGKSWYELTSQAFAVFIPVRSVGVMGDRRTYDYVIALRAVQTLDFMSAHWVHLPHKLLMCASNRIINEVQGINRVVYDISGKPPATIEWE
ncbi:glutamine-hydrolyzing GMP synthase [Candidatus Vallotia tarda]|uniref:GMP synthase [glutamine-hydrolyzing] n=1 Tax=Candidatus Vallotiella hemipterorum TaxID=1177213 RepID=A0A916NLP0_9BURK|nr:glutamine-hydrolyzing GMP synthase [Candidatus Vallotia tarda]CAG7602096.1 GMP synthase [glutamine-hydrolyzing] [Candidatus Vallotia tarda]